MGTYKKDTNKYTDWTLIDWDGNNELGYKCYRKSFRRGYVSVGVGDFKLIVYSYGNDSEDSMSSTRWSKNGVKSELEAMNNVDRNNGLHNHKDEI